ncbi:hypothetical protein QTB14_004886, partial [Salmonella enterica]|nr:hypothetical protein [Salmonella enterica]
IKNGYFAAFVVHFMGKSYNKIHKASQDMKKTNKTVPIKTPTSQPDKQARRVSSSLQVISNSASSPGQTRRRAAP